MMKQKMKDLTSSVFGYIIAYLLPGLLGGYTAAFWSASAKAYLDAFPKATSTAGLFFLVLLLALLIGVELSAFRWVIFEMGRKTRLQPEDFASLKTADRVEAFRVAVDEHYRYHQFWGGLACVLPFFFLGLARLHNPNMTLCTGSIWAVAFLIVEGVTIGAAKDSLSRYIKRASTILREGNDGKRSSEEGQAEEGER